MLHKHALHDFPQVGENLLLGGLEVTFHDTTEIKLILMLQKHALHVDLHHLRYSLTINV